MTDTYWAERDGARWDVYGKQRGWMAQADTEDDARLIVAALTAQQAQQPAAAVAADETHVFNCHRCNVSVEARWEPPSCPECDDPCVLDTSAKPAPGAVPGLLAALQAAEVVFREHGITLRARGEYKQICAAIAKAQQALGVRP